MAELDGVISLDPVAMSYLLEGPARSPWPTQELTADNVVEELLSRPYIELSTVQQDALFREAASAIFELRPATSPTRSRSSKGWAEPPTRAASWWPSFNEDEQRGARRHPGPGCALRRRRRHSARRHRPQRRHGLEDVVLPALQRGGPRDQLHHG